MKSCRYNNPDYISMYYDGVLPEDLEREFSDHLLSCRECMEALLRLEGDLFKMQSMEFSPLPERFAGMREQKRDRVVSGPAIFRLIQGKIRLLRGGAPKPTFQPVYLTPVRREGEKVTSVYRLTKEGITLELDGDGEDTFRLELSGMAGKSVVLSRGNRVVESRSRIRDEKITIGKLERGRYTLSVDGKDFASFSVD